MDALLQKFQHLKIQLEEITSATKNFDNQNCIGVGGFGNVYKAEVTHSEGKSIVAIKRLDPKRGQGVPEFLKEIMMLSNYRHDNLITLLGFCYEAGEMILVYDYASRGSLNCHLNSPHLTWSQRLNICLDAARGISYLHDPKETHQRLIHCDIKSANILLDAQWRAKVSDLGLAIKGPANEQDSVIVTLASGTRGYCDPQYAITHTLTKESDIYSFGVVLFEVLCGRLCCKYKTNGDVEKNFVPLWTESYKEKKLNEIIFKSTSIQPLVHSALEAVSGIAYRCLNESREHRPKMAEVVRELEFALDYQEFSEGKLLDYVDMTKSAEPPLNYHSRDELIKLLTKGVLLNGGERWFSLNKKGEHCEIISFAECLGSKFESSTRASEFNSRFSTGPYDYHRDRETIKACARTRFLSPGITYTVNFVFKFYSPTGKELTEYIALKYKLHGETKSSISYLGDKREDGWWMCELYQFTSDHRVFDLEILFEGLAIYGYLAVEGIEFRPLEKVEHKDEKQPISDSDANREEKLPTDYKDIMKWSRDRMQWTTKKEAYSILRKGFLINDGNKWLSLDKNGKKCLVLSPRAAFSTYKYTWLSLPESRFGEASQCHSWTLYIDIEIQSQLVSSQTTYATYLVYKLPENQSIFEAPLGVRLEEPGTWYIYLVSPQTPLIRRNADQNSHKTVHKPKIKGFPQQRNDGWMEVQFWEFQTTTTTNMISAQLFLSNYDNMILEGLIIEGVELRPI